MTTTLFLSVRVLHVLLAAVWIGSTVFLFGLLMPVIEQAGAEGGPVMMGIHRRGLAAYMGSISGLTVLSGFWLFWRFTAGFDPTISGSPSGIAYSIGGTAGLLAVILGGGVIGRSANKVFTILTQAAPLHDGSEKAGLMQAAALLRRRMVAFSKVVLALQFIALSTMAIAHYL